jgi:hypothetical protein
VVQGVGLEFKPQHCTHTQKRRQGTATLDPIGCIRVGQRAGGGKGNMGKSLYCGFLRKELVRQSRQACIE